LGIKILFVAVFSPDSTNTSQAYSFEENSCEVIRFNYREVADKMGDFNRDNLLVETCNKERPDVVVFSKCNEISPIVVTECNRYSKTVLWYMDPVDSNWCPSLTEKIQRATFVFCALTESYEKAKEIGGDKVYFLHEGYDQECNYPMDVESKYDYSFIGNLRGERSEYHKKFPFPVIQDAYAEKHSLAVSQTKINLNFTQGGTSDRTYKVLASKGFLLTEPWPEMEKDFTPGKDLVIFTNVEEMREKIDYYLHNEEERAMIASHGHETNKKFSRLNWAKSMMDKIKVS